MEFTIINSNIITIISTIACFNLVENQNDLELDLKFFSLLILVGQTLYLMNPSGIIERFEILKMASKMAVS